MTGETHTLGFGVTYDMVAARTACGQLLTLTAHRGGDRIPPHRHANDYLCIVLDGGFAEQEGPRSHERVSGCRFTHRAGQTHHDRFGPRGAMCVNLHFPTGEAGPDSEGMCDPWLRVAAQRLALELAAGPREELVLGALAVEIVGSLDPRSAYHRDRGPWLDQVIEAIADSPERRWSLRELADVAGRHPVHVAQAFRARTGISLGAFQRLRRVIALSIDLRSATGSLAMLAADYGYCDQSHMTAEFTAAFGVSPGRYRREFH